MPNALGRNLHLCFTKLKRPLIATDEPPDFQQSSSRSSATTASTTTSSSSPSPSSPVLIKNYNSLYDHNITPESTSKSLSRRTSDEFSSSDDSDTYDAAAPPPDFAAIFASQRFFFSSPGRSNSIIESQPGSDVLVGGGVPIPTYSPDPYMDFRRSMQEMVEARELSDVTADWDYLHELLLCYLELNPKHAHKFIIGAFADLIVSLVESTAGSGAGAGLKSDISGRCESARQVV